MKRISVLFILPDLNAGGAERIVTTIANHLPREKFEPKILLLRKEGAYLDFLKPDVDIVDIQTPRIRNSIFPILKEIRQRKPDIVFCGFGEVNAYLSLFIKLFPKVKFIARETNVVSKHVNRKEIRFFYKFYNNFHKIICQSEDMKADLVENFSILPEKIVKINNPVDFDFIEENLENAVRSEAYAEGYKHVLAVGNLSARKGFDNLLKVFSFLKNDRIKLHILGDGRDKDLLDNLKDELELQNVTFHGQQKNPYPYLKFADLFVLSSRYEGFPNVLLEAGACGTFALANNCPGGISEIIEPGINGEISAVEKHETFAMEIVNLLQNEHDSSKIKESIRSRFSKEIILQRYEENLTKLLSDYA